MKYPDVSLLIQGPVSNQWANEAGKYLEEYKKMFGEVILSTWTENLPMVNLMNIFDDDSSEMKIVHQTVFIDPALDLQYNIGRQTLTTLKGLRACTKPYVLKHRTDEYYSNLDVLVDKFYETGCKKWVCAPVVFGAPSYTKFHAADHLYIAPRDRLIKTFIRTMGDLYLGTYAKNYNGEPAAEVQYTYRFLEAGSFAIVDKFHALVMKENYDIVPLEELVPFSIKIGTKGFNFTTPEEVYQDMQYLRGVKTVEELMRR